jgi:O-succinylbenzoate synthase
VVVSGALESSVGLAVPAVLAAVLDLEVACGLGTGVLLAEDLVAAPTIPVGGRITAARVPPDLDALLDARGRVSDERAAWWRERLSRAWRAGRRHSDP